MEVIPNLDSKGDIEGKGGSPHTTFIRRKFRLSWYKFTPMEIAMPDPRLYESDTYVLLEPGQAERFLSTSEMLEQLQGVLAKLQNDLPRDLQKFSSVQEQARYLLETSCELEVEPGQFLQWYAVRLEK